MSYGISKMGNEYADVVCDIDASKTVWMAIALSFAMRISASTTQDAADLCFTEWMALHANGIVPQKPRRNYRNPR